MQQNIDLKKPIKFVSEKMNLNNWVATIVTDNGSQPTCLLGVVNNAATGRAHHMRWSRSGITDAGTGTPDWDICNVPEKIKVDVWLNVFVSPDGSVETAAWPTEEQASRWKYITGVVTRSACLHITAEVEPGFGLTPLTNKDNDIRDGAPLPR